MKVLLLFPPSWHPSQPYLSIPSLTAFLRQNDVSSAAQRDLNIELLDIILSREKCQEVYQNVIEELKSIKRIPAHTSETREKYQALLTAAEEMPVMMDKLEKAKRTMRSEEFYDIEKYMDSVFTINEYLRNMSALYYPSIMTAFSNDMRYSVYSSRDIFMALADEKENIFLNLYRDHILSSILSYHPELVGISITTTSQIIPGLTLAKLIKDHIKDVHVTVGGSVFTKLIENLKKLDGLFSIVDSFVVFEGEHSLLELVSQLEGRRDLRKVPNLIYRRDGITRINEPFYSEDLNKLPTPDFDGFPLGFYHSPSLVLPVQTSRGCYYRKCTFCNLHLDHRNFRLRKTGLLLEDIYKLSNKYRTSCFFFTDESVPVNKLKEVSQGILENRWNIKWMAGVRFENALNHEVLKKMSQSGCQKLVFGLESYNQRVLDLMKKGIKTDMVKNILDWCLELGISFHLYTIVGFPTETEQEAQETLDFVLQKKYVTSPGFSCLPSLFGMEKDSPITRDPPAYGLKSIKALKNEDMGLGYFYEVEQGMSPEEAERMYHRVINRLSEVLCPFPYNYSMSDGLLYIIYFKERGRN